MMGDESDNAGENREPSTGLAPMAYIRATPLGAKISVATLGTLATMLVTVSVFLLAGFRDAQNKFAANFESYGAKNQEQHTQIWSEIQGIERFLCSQFRHWEKCKQ